MFAVATIMLLSDAIVHLIAELGQQGAGNQSGESVLYQVLAALAYLTTTVLLVPRRRDLVERFLSQPMIVALVILALVSSFWALVPALALRRSLALLGTTGFAFYLTIRFSPRELLSLLTWAFGISALLSLIVVLIAPEYGIHLGGSHVGDWRGGFQHKNVMGRAMAISSAVFAVQLLTARQRRWLLTVGFILSLVLVLASGSRTAWGGTVVMLGVISAVRIVRAHFLLAVPAATAVMMLVGLTVSWLLMSHDGTSQLFGRDLTLTGRTRVWTVVQEIILQRPWTGYGYGTFWVGQGPSELLWFILGWQPSHSHNGFVDLFLDLGLLGVILFMAMTIIMVRRTISQLRDKHSSVAVWYAVIIAGVVTMAMTSPTLVNQNSITWALYVATSCYLAEPSSNLLTQESGEEEGEGV